MWPSPRMARGWPTSQAFPNAGGYRGGSWGEDGTIFVGPFGAEGRTGLQRIHGGVPDTVGEATSGEVGLFSPEILPGGHALLMVADNPGPVDRTLIEVLTLADGRRKTLVRGGASPRYLATSNASGHLVYVTNATMFAIPFDLNTLETRGTAVPVLDDVAADFSMGTGQFDVSRTGTLVYSRGNAQASGRTVRWVDPSGKMEPLLGKPGWETPMTGKWQISTTGGAQPRWRRDGKEMFYVAPGRKLMAVDLEASASSFDRGTPQPLFDSRSDVSSAFSIGYAPSADGKRILMPVLQGANREVPPLTVIVNWLAGAQH